MIWSKPFDPAQDAGTSTLGSQKPFRPYCSTVGIRKVQLDERESPNMPRKSKYDCACRVVRSMASPPTWKAVRVSEPDVVKPPQGAISSLLILLPRGGGVFTIKCADAGLSNKVK